MKNLPPNLTPAQLKAYKEIQRINLAGVMFWYLLIVFTGILAGFVYVAFWGKSEAWIKIGFALLDGIVGTSLTRVVWYLFKN